jgi:hypothetical protein
MSGMAAWERGRLARLSFFDVGETPALPGSPAMAPNKVVQYDQNGLQ